MDNSQSSAVLVDDPRTYMFFATTVSLTTSFVDDGRPANVMANEWVLNVCWNPLLIMAIVHHENLTHEYISQSKEFGINLCAMEQAHLAHYAGNISGHKADKFSHPVFADQTYPGTQIKAPMIKGCLLNAECILEETKEFGDYTGFVGRALTTRVNQKLRPLFYTRSKYFFMGNQAPKSVEVDFDLAKY